jgi:anti-sigma-K factor RskA
MKRRGEDEAGANELVELAALADDSVSSERRAELEAQVEASPELAARLREQQRALALLQGAAEQVEAPSGLRARIDAQRGPRRSQPRRLALAGVVAAATVAAVVGVAVLSSGSSSQTFHAALASTGLAPDAAGNATLTKTSSGWRIKLDATGLPRLDNGRFYEAWLKNSDGVLVPIGSFNEGQNVTLWAGVSPVDFATLTVTRERADGDQSSSGEKVLVGTVDTGS